MAYSNTGIIQDISLLYELSLSIGKSLVLQENCNNFLKTLMARKNFTFSALWLKQSFIPSLQTSQNNYISVYANPKPLLKESTLEEKNALLEKLGNKNFTSYPQKEAVGLIETKRTTQEQNGIYALFKLGDFGIVMIYSSIINDVLSDLELNKLYSIISKFTISIKACLEHERAIIVANQKLETEKSLKIAAEQQLETEKQLIEKDKLYIELVKNLQEGFLITDKEDKILFTNQRMAQLTGYSVEELIGQKAYKLFLPESAWELFEQKQVRRINGESESYEIEQFCKDGSKIWVQINAVPHRDAKGNITGSFALVSNITERKRAEKDLKISQKKLSLIIDTALDAVITIDSKSNITQWNKQAELIFGWKKEEVAGKKMHQIIVPQQHKAAHAQGMEVYLKTGKAKVLNKRIEITAIRKNGEEFPIELAISPIKFADETVFSAFVRDITQRKRAEKEILEAKKAAEDSAKAKELFLAKMSHEIRTPMNAILGLSEILLKTSLNQEQKKYLDAVSFSANNLLVIINDILDFSKIEFDKIELENIDFNIEEVVQNLYQLVNHKAEEKGILYISEFDEKINKILNGDPVRLNQALLNIVNNAIKFTDRGFVKLSCKLQSENETTQEIRFAIQDSGAGIPKEKLEHIFDSFEQADSSVTRKHGGTGLGLTISRQLVQLMGGEINVTSIVDKGTTFSFVLHFQKSKSQEEVKTLDKSIVDKNFDGIRILLVEDNKINRFYATTILEGKGFQVDIAENGIIALEKFEKNSYDIILMDIQMPMMDGIDTTKKIRTEYKSSIPILALTANAYQKDLDRYKEIGMDDCVVKPFEETSLLTKIDSLLPTIAEEMPYALTKLKESTKNNESFLKKMLQIFVEDVPIMLDAIHQGFNDRDFDKMSKQAHKLKSSIDLVEVESLYETIREVERYKEHGLDEKALKNKIETISDTCKTVIRKIKKDYDL